MISITTSTYDLSGQLIISEDPNSDLKSNIRRVSRIATLDGGCSITDQGFSHADRTLDIRQEGISQDDADRIWYLFRNYSLLRISTYDGVFLGAIQEVKINEGNLRAKILVKEKIS